ncbi:MAG TPA: sulfite exporter TauE/SafE family protein [Calditrichia bacterium]|nr:sulfite exporter TauE/SafE family protein [Calditrichota bacterium]HQU72958.1 sulfite exporter TauE/SafE family protein [Calditrichia bacterium]HQV34104.1 sulfite exporter TauE/SafE family protein [Calditrichia bacterium]
MDWLQILLLFGVGTLAGMINVMAGGGSALVLPVLIFLGLDAGTANGTNRVALLVQNFAAIWSFRRRNVSALRQSLKLGLWTLPGGILGVIVAVKISNDWFENILGVVLIFVVLSMVFSSKLNRGTLPPGTEEEPRWWIYPAMLGVGFYGGFIQVGVGFIIMAALFYFVTSDLVRVNFYKVSVVLLYTLPVLGVFILNGKVDWPVGLALAAGNSFGAWWSARLAVKKGDKLVRLVMILALIIMALKLLDVF